MHRYLMFLGCVVGLACGGGATSEDTDTDSTSGAEMTATQTETATAVADDTLVFGQVVIDFGEGVVFTVTEDGGIDIGGETVVRLTPSGEVRSIENEATTIMRLRDDGEIEDIAEGGVLGPRVDGRGLVMPNGNRIELDDSGAIELSDASGQSVDPASLGFRITGVTVPTRRASLFALAISTWLLREIMSERSEQAEAAP